MRSHIFLLGNVLSISVLAGAAFDIGAGDPRPLCNPNATSRFAAPYVVAGPVWFAIRRESARDAHANMMSHVHVHMIRAALGDVPRERARVLYIDGLPVYGDSSDDALWRMAAAETRARDASRAEEIGAAVVVVPRYAPLWVVGKHRRLAGLHLKRFIRARVRDMRAVVNMRHYELPKRLAVWCALPHNDNTLRHLRQNDASLRRDLMLGTTMSATLVLVDFTEHSLRATLAIVQSARFLIGRCTSNLAWGTFMPTGSLIVALSSQPRHACERWARLALINVRTVLCTSGTCDLDSVAQIGAHLKRHDDAF